MNPHSITRHTCIYRSKTYSNSIHNQLGSGKKFNKPDLQYLTKKSNKSYKIKYILLK